MVDMTALDDWLASADYSPETISQYRRYFQLLAEWLHGQGITLEQLRPAQFKSFLDGRPTWGAVVRHNCLYAIRAYLRASGQLDHPLLFVRIRRPEAGPQRTLSMSDVELLLQACRAGRPKDIRNAAIVTLLMDTGLRASELCRLSLAGTDLATCSLQVVGKGKRWRRCVFSPATAERIQAWLPVRQLFVAADTPALFVSVGGPTPGRGLTRYGLTLIWAELGARAGLPALSTHDFRRGFAVESARRRMPLRAMQLQGGWSNADIVSRYLMAMTLEDARDFLPAAGLTA